MEKVAANYSVFLVELRALALAVLAVQVCCCWRLLCLQCKCAAESARYLQFLQLSRIDRFVAEACNAEQLTACRASKRRGASATASGV